MAHDTGRVAAQNGASVGDTHSTVRNVAKENDDAEIRGVVGPTDPSQQGEPISAKARHQASPVNYAVPNIPFYIPRQETSPGTVLASSQSSSPAAGSSSRPSSPARVPALFRKMTIGKLVLKNRIVVSPMCQYSSEDGHVTPWHLVHLGAFAARGAGLIFVEATSVTANGRITPQDSGLWKDSQIAPLRHVVDFVHSQGCPIAVQLAHAGRKASTTAPWLGYMVADEASGGWPDDVQGPSAIAYDDNHIVPKEMSIDQIKQVQRAFVDSAHRAAKAGFDAIEIHGAHGYLVHNFLSPVSNKRTDRYGGSLENRLRFLLEIIQDLRQAWPDKPLFLRVSASDWMEGIAPGERDQNGDYKQWDIEQTAELVKRASQLGIDLVDTSSGGNFSKQKIDKKPGYQVPFAAELKKAAPHLPVGAVGLITTPTQANDIITNGEADLVFLARELLRDPAWPLRAANELGVEVAWPPQYERSRPRKRGGH